jgi:hypothetical protein
MLSGKARKVLAEQDRSFSSARRNQLSLAKIEQMCKSQEFQSAAARDKAAYDAAVSRLCGKSQDARPDHYIGASKAAALPDPVQLTLTLGMSFQQTGEEGSSKREAFKRDVANDLAKASGLPAENFKIIKLSAGSVIVDIDILPDPLGIAPAPSAVAQDLEKQADDPNSPLRSGKLTSETKGIQVLSPQPSTGAQPPPPTQPNIDQPEVPHALGPSSKALIAGAHTHTHAHKHVHTTTHTTHTHTHTYTHTHTHTETHSRTLTQPHTHNRTKPVINGSIVCVFVSVYASVRAYACL